MLFGDKKRHGGMGMFAFLMMAPALLIMGASIIMNGGNLLNSKGTNVAICPATGCLSSGSAVVLNCPLSGGLTAALGPNFANCEIEPYCIPNPPPPAFCFGWPLNYFNKGTYLPDGDTVVLNATQVAQGNTPQSAIFGFGALSSSYTDIIIVATGVVIVMSLVVLGTGLGGEGVHIIAVSGVMLGIWVILTALANPGSPASLFGALNSFTIAGVSSVFGTLLYVICSIGWTLAWLAAFTRGV